MSGIHKDGVAQGEGGTAALVPVDVAKSDDSAVQKAMEHVTSLVDSIAKAAGVKPAAEPEKPATDVKKSEREVIEETFKSNGMSGASLTQAMAAYDAGKAPAATAEVEKGAKTFTAERIAKLQEAVIALQKLMMEVIPTGDTPMSKVPQVERHANPNTTRAALVTKADEDVIKALVEKVDQLAHVFKGNPAATEQLDAISKRLDTIEKTRLPNSSQGDDNPKPVQKGSLWGGLL